MKTIVLALFSSVFAKSNDPKRIYINMYAQFVAIRFESFYFRNGCLKRSFKPKI